MSLSKVVRIVTLAEAPGLVAPLAEAFARQWPDWTSRVTQERVERCFACARPGELPQAFAAVIDGEPVGTVSLQTAFADEPMPETPWIRGLLVVPAWRGRGIDRLLVGAAERTARSQGFRAVYAATSAIETLALRRGWEVFRRVEHDGQRLAWMRKNLRSPN